MERPRSVTVIMWLAIVQGILASLMGLLWVQIGSIFDQEDGGMAALIMRMAKVRGGLLVFLSLLYFLFAVGAWQIRAWAWWVGLLVSSMSILVLVDLLLQGGLIGLFLAWLIVPLIMVWYLLSPTGRQVFIR